MKRLISVVITTYGRMFDEILRSIESVGKQIYNNTEIILVDDNNPDSIYRKDIEKKIIKYNNVIYIKHKCNLGAQSARNTGIKNSHGELIAFLDDDDEWLENKLLLQEKVIKKDVGLVYCQGYIVNERTKEQTDYVTSKRFKKNLTFNELLYADQIGTTTQALIPKYVFYDVGFFDVNQPARQDYEMWLRIAKKYKCIGIEKPLFKHYIHSGQQISKSNEKAIKGLENIYYKYKTDYRHNYIASFHINYLLLNRYIKNINFCKAFCTFFKIIYYLILSIIFDFKNVKKFVKEHFNEQKI